MLCLALTLLLQEPEEAPKRPPYVEPTVFLSLAPSYFEIHQPGLDDAYGLSLLAQARLDEPLWIEAGARGLFGGESGRDADLAVYSLGAAGVGSGHGGGQAVRFSWSGGAVVLASGDLDDRVDFGVFAAFQITAARSVSFRYEVVVPEADASIGGRELELIQGFSLGLALSF